MSGFGGGISSFIKNKAEALKNTDIQFDVLTYDKVSKEFENAILLTGGRIYYMSNPKKSSYKKFIKDINTAMQQSRASTIVHSHIQGYRFLPFYLIAKKNKIKKIIVHAHTDLDLEQNKSLPSRINRFVNTHLPIEKASCGIKASRTIFGEKSINNKEIMHIPNSIEPSVFQKPVNIESKRKELVGSDASEQLIIGNIARFNKQKNHHFMISVADKIRERTLDFVILLVGTGELEMEIKEEVKKKNLENHIKFLGRRNDVSEILKAIDVFILPSLYEGLPTVSIEAQAAGAHTLLADTITKESDLELGLVEFLPLDTEEWAYKLTTLVSKQVDEKEIINTLIDKKFTNVKSADLYKKFLYGQINHYEI